MTNIQNYFISISKNIVEEVLILLERFNFILYNLWNFNNSYNSGCEYLGIEGAILNW